MHEQKETLWKEVVEALKNSVEKGLEGSTEVKRLVIAAECIVRLVDLKSRAVGKSLKDERSFQLEEKRLKKYKERILKCGTDVQTLDPATMARRQPTARFISHALWKDLSSSQKQQFKKVTCLPNLIQHYISRSQRKQHVRRNRSSKNQMAKKGFK